VGEVEAVGEGGQPLTQVTYFLLQDSSYFSVNRTTGVIYIIKDLFTISRKKRISEDKWHRRALPLEGLTLLVSRPTGVKHSLAPSQVLATGLGMTLNPARLHLVKRETAPSYENITLIIVVQSGLVNPKQDEAMVVISIDKTCSGCGGGGGGGSSSPGPPDHQGSGGGSLSGTPLILLIVFVIFGVALLIVGVVVGGLMYRRRSRKKKAGGATSQQGVINYGAVDIRLSPLKGDHSRPGGKSKQDESPLDELTLVKNREQVMTSAGHQSNREQGMTTGHQSMSSEVRTMEGAQSRGASSGRGSTEQGGGSVGGRGDEMDEEIRMINSCQSLGGVASKEEAELRGGAVDSGIARDDEDTVSEMSIRNHVEYLARLGVDTSRIDGEGVRSQQGGNLGGGRGGSLASQEMNVKERQPQQRLRSDAIGRPVADSMRGTAARVFGGRDIAVDNPSVGLTSIINTEEVLSGSYNWDYLLGWGPQYLPLADMFTELATLKDDTLTAPRAAPPLQRVSARSGPPPIITDTPPSSGIIASAFNPPRLAPLSGLTIPHPQAVNHPMTYDMSSEVSYDLQHPAMMRQYTQQVTTAGAGRSRSPSVQSDYSVRKGHVHISSSIHSGHSSEQSSSHVPRISQSNHSSKYGGSTHIPRSNQSNNSYRYSDSGRIEEEDNPAQSTRSAGSILSAGSARAAGGTHAAGSTQAAASRYYDTPPGGGGGPTAVGLQFEGSRLRDIDDSEVNSEYHDHYRPHHHGNQPHPHHHSNHPLDPPARSISTVSTRTNPKSPLTYQSNFTSTAIAPPFLQTLSPLGAQSPAYLHDVLPSRHVNIDTGSDRLDLNNRREARI